MSPEDAPCLMLRAIEAAAAGQAIFSPAIATRLIDFFGYLPPGTPTAVPRAQRARAADPPVARVRACQPGDRAPTGSEPENGSQQPLEHLQQAPGRGPHRSDHPCP